MSNLYIALDPGGTTGIAWQAEGIVTLATHQVPDCGTGPGLLQLFVELNKIIDVVWGPVGGPAVQTTIIYESFDFRHDETYRDKIDYIPAEVIGALKYWALDRPSVQLVKQNAATGKGFWTDDKIKRLGLWVPGRRHAMDALRHLLRYKTFVLDQKDLLQRLRPIN